VLASKDPSRIETFWLNVKKKKEKKGHESTTEKSFSSSREPLLLTGTLLDKFWLKKKVYNLNVT